MRSSPGCSQSRLHGSTIGLTLSGPRGPRAARLRSRRAEAPGTIAFEVDAAGGGERDRGRVGVRVAEGAGDPARATGSAAAARRPPRPGPCRRARRCRRGAAPRCPAVSAPGARSTRSARRPRGRHSPAARARVAPVRVAPARAGAGDVGDVTSVAPKARRPASPSRPIGPAPVTSTRSPGADAAPCGRPRRRPTAAPSARRPRRTACRAARTRSPRGSSTYSANAPSTGGVAKKTTSAQRLYRPARHSRQRPQGTPGSSVTRSPTACLRRPRAEPDHAAGRLVPEHERRLDDERPIRPCS